MASRAHCQNILNELVGEVGIGVSYGLASKSGSKNSWLYWTQLFGTRDPGSVSKWSENPGFNACPHTKMVHPAPAEPTPPAAAPTTTPTAPTGTASVVVVNGQQRVAVTGAAPGLTSVRVTTGREQTVRRRISVGRAKATRIRTCVVFTPGPSVVVRVSAKTGTYKAVVGTPPPAAKGKLVVRVSNTKAKVSRRIPVRTS